MRLFDFLFPPRADEKIVRETSIDEILGLLSPELVRPEHGNATALLPFHTSSVRAVVHEAKYHGSEKAFTLLATVLTDYLQDADVDLARARLVPVPLGRERRKKRGFNQTEEFVRRTAKALGMMVDTKLLVRTRETVSQISLPREERLKNMHGAFSSVHSASPSHLYIVIDDVCTTGATLTAACNALREAGATHILPLALAH